jgi:hypothetical protein
MKKSLLFTILGTMALSAAATETSKNHVMDLRSGEFTFSDNGAWTDTYNEDAYTVDVDIFSASHSSGWSGSYYDGFIPCISTDNTDHSSDGWVANQWGCMAGGAVKVDENGNVLTDEEGNVLAEEGAPYLMCYWSAWYEYDENHVAQILLSTDKAMYAKEVYVSTHPYAYYTLVNGDSFSRAFNQADDEFTLLAHGLNSDFEDNGKVVKYVLTNTVDNGNGEYVPNQSTNWQRVDLSELGEVAGVYFTMESTDTGDYGINTPTYFCLDRFTVSEEPTSSVKEIAVEGNSTPIYYTLQGVKVSGANLAPGVYVKVVNGKASKVQIR